MSGLSQEHYCIEFDEAWLRWPEWEATRRKRRVELLQQIVNHPIHNDAHKLCMVEVLMGTFEREDETVRRLQELLSTPSPPAGSDEARGRRQTIGEHVLKLFMMDHQVYAQTRHVHPRSSA